ncbi:MAG TPA: HAD family hydrolase [Thermoanaerobaculales bacterium]|nr:HAD family hydrolase [Thermoanaerobaculales bacterium]HQL30577.1 HAD family hydrolase [Thermoanaerobaculales bacterium]HQN95872.1 HAD family hydrolase [Thermoanaerobaculales bacterium]HQP43934.1 HAD family hydrolase [Thermoanaerobaculales bacterium]
MRALALDFDGVLSDSAREVFTIAVRTYARLHPGSAVVEATLAGPAAADGELDLSAAPTFAAFRQLMPLGSRSEDFGVALHAMELGLELADQAAWDGFHRLLDPEWLRAFHLAFYETRDGLRTGDEARWLALYDSYPGLAPFLRRAAGRVALAVATARDAASVDVLLGHLGIADLIPSRLRLDKETGIQKTEHLTALAERLGIAFSDITFIDDRVNQLERVAPLGVRPVLAGWGHNTPREHARAASLGFPVAQLDNLDALLPDIS